MQKLLLTAGILFLPLQVAHATCSQAELQKFAEDKAAKLEAWEAVCSQYYQSWLGTDCMKVAQQTILTYWGKNDSEIAAEIAKVYTERSRLGAGLSDSKAIDLVEKMAEKANEMGRPGMDLVNNCLDKSIDRNSGEKLECLLKGKEEAELTRRQEFRQPGEARGAHFFNAE